MSDATEHIAAWEAAGVIDPRTADRLRAAEAGLPADASSLPPRPRTRRGTTVAAIFGPGLTIGEMFGYLGVGFMLGAVDAFFIRVFASSANSELGFGIGFMIQALLLATLGAWLRGGDLRRQRAAGVALLVAVANTATSVGLLSGSAGLDWPQTGVVATAFALLTAIGTRRFHPSLLTQVAVLATLTGLALATLAWVEMVIAPNGTEGSASGVPDPLILAVAAAVWWIVIAVVIGLIGLGESRQAIEDPAAGRRAALTRLWAGLVVVSGVATSLMRSDVLADGSFGRVIEPRIADLALLILCGVLVERAFRREASAYVYAAALGTIVALTDFNLTYLSQSSELGLLIEGAILLAAGFAADRLRRRLGDVADDLEVDDAPPRMAPVR